MPNLLKKKKLLLVESYPHVLFGQQKKKLAFIDSERARRYDLEVVVPGMGVFVDEVASRGVAVRCLPYPEKISGYGKPHRGVSLLERVALLLSGLKYVHTVASCIKAEGYDVVFCEDLRGVVTIGLASRFLGKPVIYWDNTDEPNGIFDIAAALIVSKFVFLSEAVRSKYPRLIWRYVRKVRSAPKIPTGVNLKSFDSGNSIRDEMGLDDDEIVFAIIGSITRRKGHDRVLAIVDKVFEVLPGAKLLVVGETNLSEEDTQFFNSLPNRMHPKVQFTGYRGDIENVMHSIDILLVPSRHEGQGQVVTQAMACRKPVVGAIVGGIAEAVIDGKTGLLVSGDEQDDWLNAMIRLGRDVIQRKQMGNAGRERVEQLYEWEHEIGRLFDVIDSCG